MLAVDLVAQHAAVCRDLTDREDKSGKHSRCEHGAIFEFVSSDEQCSVRNFLPSTPRFYTLARSWITRRSGGEVATIFRCAMPGNLAGITSESRGADGRYVVSVQSITRRVPSRVERPQRLRFAMLRLWRSQLSSVCGPRGKVTDESSKKTRSREAKARCQANLHG